MIPVNLLILLLFVPFSNTNPFPTVSPDTAYLRTFLPWWPNNTDFSLRAAPTPENVGNTTEISLLSNQTGEYQYETVSDEEEVDPSTLRVQSLPASPLDALSPEGAPKSFITESMRHHDGNFIIDFEGMGECPRDCSNDLREAMGIVLQDMSHVERYRQICEKYSNASVCVNEDSRCDKDDRGMFEMMTSGFHYMCVEQELAFNATIKCIDDEAGLVQSECDAQCQTKNLFMNWMMRTAFQDSIQQGVQGIVGAATGANANPLAFLQGAQGAAGASAAAAAGGAGGWADMLATAGQRPPSPQDAQQGFENFRQFTNDLCRIGDCMLDCIRSKFNTRCEGSAGTLLSEVFVRPIAASQNKLSILRPVLGSFMPEQCNYLTNNADLKKHRIDSTMDEELKRMYAEKMAKEIRDRTAQDELLSNLVPLDKNGVPLPRALPELKPIDSPLDVSVRTLDQLILDMYSKNETEALNISEKNNVTATFSDSEEDEQAVNATLETTESQVAKTISYVETATATMANADGEAREAVDGSAQEPAVATTFEASGDGEKSESSGAVSENDEASGEPIEESGDGLLTVNEEGSGEGSGEDESSGNSSGETSGSESLIRNSESFAESSGEGSGVEESSGISGESSGDYDSSGDDAIPFSTTPQEVY